MAEADPYLAYNFRVKWEGRYVAAVTSVSGLTHKTQVVVFRAGGQPQQFKVPGTEDYEPVRLSRGITTDAGFRKWAMQMDTHRNDMEIEVYNQAGDVVLRYKLTNCWATEYTALPELDSERDTVALASMTLEHEGWEREPVA